MSSDLSAPRKRIYRTTAALATLIALSQAWLPAQTANDPKGGSPVITPTELAPPADVESVVAGNNRFALDLYSKLREGTGNRFFSPYSVSTALAMTYAGARGETAAQMAQTLRFALPPDRLHPAFHALISQTNEKSKPGAAGSPDTLVTANALWGQHGEGFLDAFLKVTRENYGAGLRELDFKKDPQACRRTINAWVEEQTRDKIKDLIGPSDVTTDTSLVLTNAIYFKGRWAHPFRESLTNPDGVFRAPGGKSVKTPMMSQQTDLRYFDAGSFHLVEMPYVERGLAMTVVLPKKDDGLAEVEAKLDAPGLRLWADSARTRPVRLEFPRFKLTESLELARVLADMGMPSAFGGREADFSGMNGRRDLSISAVIHKAFVDVNEKGTEAAAATGVVMARAAAIQPQLEPVEFKVDHPFLFFINDRTTGSVLFVGRVLDPSGS
ncbi:MAG: serpin family protein [Isosphaeraceae bacterium]